MKATKPIQTDEEVFNDYGELPRADLLRRYGYITDNYADYDVVDLPFQTIFQAAGFSCTEQNEHPRVSLPNYLTIECR